jgi:Xaa-Pro dipeptidase
MLEPKYCRQRQQRLLEKLRDRPLDAVVVGMPAHVLYLGAFQTHWLHQSAFILFGDSRSWLITANTPGTFTAADEVVAYEAQWHATLRQEQPNVVAEFVCERLRQHGASRIAIDASAVTSQLPLVAGEDLSMEPIDPVLWQLRRVKDPDELALMSVATREAEAMYARARQIIEPGVPELRVFAELHAAAVEAAGEPMSAPLGNDYVCGKGGGPPRKGCVAQAGQIYIVDVGPSHRGYFADACRSFSVDRRPTDAQMKAWRAVIESLEIVERVAKPGARCREIFAAVDAHLKMTLGRGMTHHLGHGVGLQPHEYPHLNPHAGWDDVLLEGEVFSAEPAVYGTEINWGIRIENEYLVTHDGVRKLIDSPTELS